VQGGHAATTVLPAADVALHQAQHRFVSGEVGADRGQHALLCRGQRERQACQQPGRESPRWTQGRCAMAPHREALQAQAELMGQQFLEGETPLRRMRAGQQCRRIRVRRWPMCNQQGFAQRWQVVPASNGLRQQFQIRIVRQAFQRARHALEQGRLAQSFGGRIDRGEAAFEPASCRFLDALVGRVHHLEAVAAVACFAVSSAARCRGRTAGPGLRGSGRSAG
jgi:hypothetical protein